MTIVNNYLVMVSKGITAIILVSTFLAACTKERITIQPVKIEGNKEEKIGFGLDQKGYPYAFYIKPGSILYP